MAHSFIFVKNAKTDKTIAVTDSLLHVFMYFFNESINMSELSEEEIEIRNHYAYEMDAINTSFIDLKLQEVYDNNRLLLWYFIVLLKLNSLFNSFGGVIDHNTINELPNFKKKFVRPLDTNKLKNLVNDIFWLLNKENTIPSEDFKWFEEPLN